MHLALCSTDRQNFRVKSRIIFNVIFKPQPPRPCTAAGDSRRPSCSPAARAGSRAAASSSAGLALTRAPSRLGSGCAGAASADVPSAGAGTADTGALPVPTEEVVEPPAAIKSGCDAFALSSSGGRISHSSSVANACTKLCLAAAAPAAAWAGLHMSPNALQRAVCWLASSLGTSG